jgi:hypothetical protein
MKMKPIIEVSWDLQNVAKDESNQESSGMGPMISIDDRFCCAC